MGPTQPLLCLFSSFSQHTDKYSTNLDYKQKKRKMLCVDSNPQDCRMLGADKSTKLRRSPFSLLFVSLIVFDRNLFTYTEIVPKICPLISHSAAVNFLINFLNMHQSKPVFVYLFSSISQVLSQFEL